MTNGCHAYIKINFNTERLYVYTTGVDEHVGIFYRIVDGQSTLQLAGTLGARKSVR